MYNLIKMEMYRLFKAKTTWLIIVFSILFLFLAVVFTNTDLQAMKEVKQELSNTVDLQTTNVKRVTEQGVTVDENNVQMNVGVYFDTNYEWIDHDVNVVEFFIIMLKSGSIILVLTFFAAMFVNGDNKHGFIKNIAGQMHFKGNLFLSKLPAVLIFNVMLFTLNYFFTLIFVKCIIGKIDLSLSKTAVKAILLQLMLHFAFSCVVAMFAAVTKSTAFSATVGTIFCCGAGSIIWVFINMVVERLNIAEDFIINNYTLVYNIQQIGLDFNFENTLRIITVAAVFVALSSIISVIAMNRRDVK